MNRLLLAVLLSTTLAGCATAPDLPQNYALDAARAEGVAIVSLTLTGMPLDKTSGFEYRLRELAPRPEEAVVTKLHPASPQQHARSLWDNEGYRPLTRQIAVKGLDTAEPLDILNNGKPVGRLAVLRLPPGNYEFHGWKVKAPDTHGEREYAPAQAYSYRFSIKPGAATYIGRLHLDLDGQRSQRLTLEDQRHEDLATLGKKHPGLSAAPVDIAVGRLQL